jgi:hypothetical protein
MSRVRDELARGTGLAHLLTLGRVRALAHLDGRELCSRLLDPRVNDAPELPPGGKAPTATGRVVIPRGGGRRSVGEAERARVAVLAA